MLEYGWGDFEHTHLIVVFDDNWVLSDFARMSTDIVSLAGLAQQPVKLLFDLRQAGSPPSNLMQSTGWLFEHLPETVTSIIIISSDTFWHSIFKISHDIYASRKSMVHRVMTVDEAYHLLIDGLPHYC